MDDYDISSREVEICDIEWSQIDVRETEKQNVLMTNGCCKDKCTERFSVNNITNHRDNCFALEHDQLDLIIMSHLTSNTAESRTSYRHNNIVICREMFCFLYGIGEKRLKLVRAHFFKEGLVSRTHGNKNRQPQHALTGSRIREIKDFISNYSTSHGLSLPGRIAGHRDERVTVLPSQHTKTVVYNAFVKSSNQPISRSSFFETWSKFTPYIISAKPRTDLCFTCQKNNEMVFRTANMETEEKLVALQKQTNHLKLSDQQRKHYNNTIEKGKRSLRCCSEVDSGISKKLANSKDVINVVSFDFAQQVHYPNNPEQPGAIFFKVPRKCALFGVCNELLNRQTTYLIDEAVECGKGANTVISYLHHFLEWYGFGEKNLELFADNCCGQNKNNAMIQYLYWRVSKSLHSNINLNFLLAGHTKFAPDRNFGLIKKNYRRRFVSSLYEIGDAVEDSSAHNNVAELVGSPNGKVNIPVYNWSDFFKNHFNNVPEILKQHHFRISKNESGCIFTRLNVESKEFKFIVVRKDQELPDGMPEIVVPEGLSMKRKLYLNKEIRPFCKLGTENLTAPAP